MMPDNIRAELLSDIHSRCDRVARSAEALLVAYVQRNGLPREDEWMRITGFCYTGAWTLEICRNAMRNGQLEKEGFSPETI